VRTLGLLVLGPTRTFRVAMTAGAPWVVGRATTARIQVSDPALPPQAVALSLRESDVVVEELRPYTGARLNDVQLSGPGSLKPGDELTVGNTRLVVLPPDVHAVPTRPRVTAHDELVARLEDEVARASAGRRPVLFAMVAMPALNTPARQAFVRRLWEETARAGAAFCLGQWTPDVLGLLVPELSPEASAALLGRLPSSAGPRARVAGAIFPGDGDCAEELVERCLTGLYGEPSSTDPVIVDPVMVRLFDAADRLAAHDGPVRVFGPPGAGRATLARAIAQGEAVAEAQAWNAKAVEALLAAPEKHVLLREVHRLEPDALGARLAAFKAKKKRVFVTAPPSAHDGAFELSLPVPALVERPHEILPIAEAYLTRFRLLLGRPRLVLGSEARAQLLRYPWPGNVRELRNVMARAARAAVRDEVGLDALPARLTQEAPAENLRSALKDTERALLLETLARTRWNVTQAAARLGLPRRTVVYRMAKLGLKRPAR
jgi:DNA-binding protein Fis/pSer/pThr/pTyr-binding forkhead associated (FHA) protein